MAPLSSVVQAAEAVQAASINHTGMVPSVTLSWGLKPGVGRSKAKLMVEQAAREVLPPGVTGRWVGVAARTAPGPSTAQARGPARADAGERHPAGTRRDGPGAG